MVYDVGQGAVAHSRGAVRMEGPAVLLAFFDDLTDVVVVRDLDTFPFFRSISPSQNVLECRIKCYGVCSF